MCEGRFAEIILRQKKKEVNIKRSLMIMKKIFNNYKKMSQYSIHKKIFRNNNNFLNYKMNKETQILQI